MSNNSYMVTLVAFCGIILAMACVKQDDVVKLEDSGACALTTSDSSVVDNDKKSIVLPAPKELLYCPAECIDDIDDEAPMCAPGDYGAEIVE